MVVGEWHPSASRASLSLATLLQDGNHHLSKILYLKPASCDCLYFLLFLIGHYLAGVKWILTLVLTLFLVIKSVRSTYCSLYATDQGRELYITSRSAGPLLQVASLVLSLHVQSSLIKVVYSEHAERNKEGEWLRLQCCYNTPNYALVLFSIFFVLFS